MDIIKEDFINSFGKEKMGRIRNIKTITRCSRFSM